MLSSLGGPADHPESPLLRTRSIALADASGYVMTKIKGFLPPIVPQPLARHSGHVVGETRLQLPIEVEVGAIRQPIQAIFVESSRQVRSQGKFLSRRGSVFIERLVRVMNAFLRATGKDFDVGFLIVTFVKEWA